MKVKIEQKKAMETTNFEDAVKNYLIMFEKIFNYFILLNLNVNL